VTEAGAGEHVVPATDGSAGVDASVHDVTDAVVEEPCPGPPTFSPPSGTEDPGNVVISDPGLPLDGVIYYTIRPAPA
jgi:hypothetical protein